MARRDTILVSKTLYQMGVVTLIGAIFWVGLSVYHALVKPPDVNVDKVLLEPINPVIDQATVASLSARLSVTQELPQDATISGEEVR
jgi:hypothetical protein